MTETPPGERRFPWALLFHWCGRYLVTWCCLALVIFAVQALVSAFLHDREDAANLLGFLNSMPFIKSILGGEDLVPGNVLGIVAIGYLHPLVLTMLMTNAVIIPTGLLTAQCEQGTMEALLARPLGRSQVHFVVTAIALASEVLLVAVVFVGTATWTRVFDFGVDVPLGEFVRVSINLALMACAAVGVSLLVAVVCSERGRAVGVIVGFLVLSYLLDLAAVWLSALKPLQPLSLFGHCNPNEILDASALPWTDLMVLAAVLATTWTASWRIWRRRDLYAA